MANSEMPSNGPQPLPSFASTSSSSNATQSNSNYRNPPNFHEAVEDLISNLHAPNDEDPLSEFNFQDSTFAKSASQFADQASLLSQNASLDNEIDAGALDECLYNMWSSETDYNKWRGDSKGTETGTSPLGDFSPSNTSSSIGFNLSGNNINDGGATTSASPPRASAKKQFNQLLAALAPPPQEPQPQAHQSQSSLSPQEISSNSIQIFSVSDHLRQG